MTGSIDEQFREVMNLMREGNAVDGISLLKDIWTRLSEGQFTMSIQHFDEFIMFFLLPNRIHVRQHAGNANR